jgi:hypothetical protein
LSCEEPREFEVEEFRNDMNSFKQNPKLPVGRNTEKNASNTISQLYSINKALGLANEVNKLDKFDYYVLTRYDCVIGSFLKPSRWSSHKLYLTSHHDFPDPILIGSPKLVNATNAFPCWRKLASNTNVFLTPEDFKKIEFLNHFENSSYTNVRSRVEFLRSDSKLRGIILLYIKMSPFIIFMRRLMGKVTYEFRRLNESIREIRS